VNEDQLVQSIEVYQSSCWHCNALWFKPPRQEPDGRRCRYCNELNIYPREEMVEMAPARREEMDLP
jgi:hypothetical protein